MRVFNILDLKSRAGLNSPAHPRKAGQPNMSARFFLILFVAVILCFPVGAQTSATIDAPPESIKTKLIQDMMRFNYRLETESDHQLTFIKEITGKDAILPTIFMGNRYSENPKKHVQYTLLQDETGKTRVDVAGAITVKMAFGKENRSDISRAAAFQRDAGAELHSLLALSPSYQSSEKDRAAVEQKRLENNSQIGVRPIPGLARVHFYQIHYSGGAKVPVLCNGKEIGKVDNGHVLMIPFDPGKYQFSSSDGSPLSYDLEADHDYFVRIDVERSAFSAKVRLSSVSQEQGKPDTEMLIPQ